MLVSKSLIKSIGINSLRLQQQARSVSYFSTVAAFSDESESSNAEARELVRTPSNPPFTPSDVIVKKRDGEQLSAEEIDWFVQSFHKGQIQDHQMSSFLMAACTRGLSNQEASDLTKAMVNTGEKADLSSIRPACPKVDKHSTGGVGDTVSLILTPLVACFDIVVPMMAGRGLGFSGGTLDKIESVTGARTNLTTQEYLNQLEEIGCAICAPTPELAPVDSTMYALRDCSGSVENTGLVASSIMSKKLAEGPDAILLDVKIGDGAFFKTLNDAASLAKMMVSIGEQNNIDTCALITNMNQPLGGAVGNFLEVREAVQVLGGNKYTVDDEFLTSPVVLKETRDLALAEAAIMLGLGGKVECFSEGLAAAEAMLESGAALDKFAEILSAQGGDSSILFDLSQNPVSMNRLTHYAEEDVIIQQIDAYEIGMAVTRLGAGRRFTDQPIDHHAGLLFHAKVGHVVEKGQPIFTAVVGEAIPNQSGCEQSHALDDPDSRLHNGFERALGAIRAKPNTLENYVAAPPIIEYFVDRNGLTSFQKGC